MEEEELEEERRVVREAEVEETGARRALGRVTGKQMGHGKEKFHSFNVVIHILDWITKKSS